MMFDKGDRVNTPQGPGKVVYRRMDHLGDINQVAAYSVALDHKVEACNHPPFPSYSGTIFPAGEVKPEKE